MIHVLWGLLTTLYQTLIANINRQLKQNNLISLKGIWGRAYIISSDLLNHIQPTYNTHKKSLSTIPLITAHKRIGLYQPYTGMLYI